MELKVIKNTPIEPHYTLILEYILGDYVVSGIQTSIDFNESDEDIKNFITVLEKLKGKRLKRRWGWMWDNSNYEEAVEEGILNEDDIKIIKDIEDDFIGVDNPRHTSIHLVLRRSSVCKF